MRQLTCNNEETFQATANLIPIYSLVRKVDSSIIQHLNQPSTISTTRNLQYFVVVNSELYHQGSGGVFARAFSLTEAKKELHIILDLSC